MDYRMIDDQQMLPAVKAGRNSGARTNTRPVDHWFWLMAFLLFIAERIIAYRKQKLANG